MTRPLLSIVVPLYRSADSIERLIQELSALPVDGGCELVLVNDGSPDNTAELAEKFMQSSSRAITLVKLSRNFGEYNAVMAGLHHAQGEYIVTMDDDLQNPPSEVLKLLQHARTGGYDVVYSYYADKKHDRWRNFGSWLTNRVSDLLLDKPRGLYLSSFRVMSSFVAKEVCRHDGPYVYVDGLILQVTQKIGRLQVEHAERATGVSGYTFRRLVRLWLVMFVGFSVMPLRLATLVGFLMAGSGFLFMIVVIVLRLMYGAVEGWSSLMAALLLFSGTQLILLGVAGEYIGRTYLTANKKPQFVVRDVVRNGPAGQ
ncbi:MAG: glycosyltransferase family 2 protein [Planctomycetes bacterium]|jgi:glycosyltransferase involved in cell wall biosynthesis|nr:glycosyltransferase family 2 protein [Planctomycetota bacterium]MCC7061978.1 glycosyltransferase family 2 protein [Planctomycetota bacterium]